MKKPDKKNRLTLIIVLLGIVIGFLGELMPDNFQQGLGIWTSATFKITYSTFWIISTTLIVGLLILLTWKQAHTKETFESENIHFHDQQPSITDSKNTVVNSSVKADGSIHIGDTMTVNNEQANINNQFNGGTFNNPTFE